MGFASRRVMELLIQDWSLTAKLRLPAISRLQKVHNVDMALQVLKSKGVDLKDEHGNSDFSPEQTAERLFALHKMRFGVFLFLCDVFFHRSVTLSLCFSYWALFSSTVSRLWTVFI